MKLSRTRRGALAALGLLLIALVLVAPRERLPAAHAVAQPVPADAPPVRLLELEGRSAVAPAPPAGELQEGSAAASALETRVLEAPPGVALGGVVVDGAGAPLEGATVELHAIAGRPLGDLPAEPRQVVRTLSDGRFSFSAEGLPERVSVTAWTADRARRWIHGLSVPVECVITLAAPAGSIRGVVRAEGDSAGLPGVRVWCASGGLEATSSQSLTDTEGAYGFDGLAAGVYRVSAAETRHGEARTDAFVMAGAPCVIDLVLPAAELVRGLVVRRRDGSPIPGATVTDLTRSIQTDEQGRFEFARPPDASRIQGVIVEKEGFARNAVTILHSSEELRIELLEPVRYALRVRLPANGAAGLRVHMEQFIGLTLARSAAELHPLEDGTVLAIAGGFWPPPKGAPTAYVEARGCVAAHGTAISWDPERTQAHEVPLVSLSAGACIRGHVRDEAGAPVQDAQVSLLSRQGTTPEGAPIVVSANVDAAGAFSMSGLAAGSYALSAYSRGFRGVRSGVDLDESQAVLEVPLELQRAGPERGELSGIVRAPDGTPLVAMVFAKNAFEDQWIAKTDSGGQFTLVDLPLEPLQVWTMATLEGRTRRWPRPPLEATPGDPPLVLQYQQ